MEVKNISYAEFGELIKKVEDENVKRRKELEKEIKQLEMNFFNAEQAISCRIALEETVIDEIIERLKVLKTDMKYYRKSLILQIEEREKSRNNNTIGIAVNKTY